MTARALTNRGVARRFNYLRADVQAIREGIVSALGDSEMATAAKTLAIDHEPYRRRDVLAEIIAVCETLAA